MLAPFPSAVRYRTAIHFRRDFFRRPAEVMAEQPDNLRRILLGQDALKCHAIAVPHPVSPSPGSDAKQDYHIDYCKGNEGPDNDCHDSASPPIIVPASINRH